MIAKGQVEKRTLKAHANLIYTTIMRQAGTQEKAILEGVMNAIDARATKCEIEVTPSKIIIRDDGKGFQKREEIEGFFETFGQPHDASEGKIYGTFRIGRGQIFAFGRNVWTSGPFQMTLDVKNTGLDYELETRKEVHAGCQIEIQLYEKLLPSVQHRIRDSLAIWVRWAQIPVFYNGDQISENPDDAEWDHVTDEAYIKLTATGDLEIYNLGVHVHSHGNYQYGTGGTVVARKQLKVNMARNEVQSDCPVWRAIQRIVNQKAGERATRAKALNDDQRRFMLKQLLTEQIVWDDVAHQKLIVLANSKAVPLSEFPVGFRGGFKWPAISVAPRGDRAAIAVINKKMAFVFAEDMLRWCGVKTVEALVEKLMAVSPHDPEHTKPSPVKKLEELAAGIKNEFEDIPEKDWTKREQAWLNLASSAMFAFNDLAPRSRARRLNVGTSPDRDSWTDGSTFITIDRRFLADLTFNLKSVVELGVLLLHAMSRNAADLDEPEEEDVLSLRRFHDNADSLGTFTQRVVARMPATLKRFELDETKVALRTADTLAELDNMGINAVGDESDAATE